MAEFRKLRIEQEAANSIGGKKILDPPGFDHSLLSSSTGSGSSALQRPTVSLEKRQAALMTQAYAPLKQVAMLCFMMWMSGSQLHLFSIMTTISGLYQPLSAMLRVREAFPEDPEGKLSVTLPRLVYSGCQLLGVAFALYKINGMGLFPTHLSDWVSSIRAPMWTEHAVSSVLPAAVAAQQ